MQLGHSLSITNPRLVASGGGGADNPLAELYGTGLGQIPLHLAPEYAVLDGSGNVVSVPNRGGAGAAFDSAATGSGILIADGMFSVPTFGPYLQMGAAADLVGIRAFFIGQPSADLPHDARIMGSADHNTHVRVNRVNSRISLFRGGETVNTGGFHGPPAALRLYELEITGGAVRVFINGAQSGTTDPLAWPDMKIDRIFSGQSTYPFQGLAGAFASVITDGSASYDPVMQQVRQVLAAKHGITLA